MAAFALKLGITELNLDVLELIFTNLPYLEDKISLGRTHPFLGEAFAFHCRNRFQNITFESLSVKQWSFVLSMCGDSVKELTSRSCTKSVAMLRLFVKYCAQGVKLDFVLPIESEYNALVELLEEMKSKHKLKEICMRITDNSNSADPVVKALVHLPALRKLELHNFTAKEICHVNNLTDLEVLQIHVDVLTQKLDVFQMLAALKNLRSFEIWEGYLELTVGNGRAIVLQSEYAEHMKKLRFFRKMRGGRKPKEAKVIAKLKSLKKLYWQAGDNCCLELLTNLNQLENLTLVNSNEITNEDLLKVLRACKKIRHLTIRNCAKILPSFIWSANEILRENNVQPDDPLKLHVDMRMMYETEKMLSLMETDLLILEEDNF